MNIAAQRAVDQRDEGLTEEHIAQGEPEETPVLIDTILAERRQVQGAGNESIGEHRHAIL
jgi:hypothetical protein